MDWSYRRIKKQGWNAAFKKGFQSWMLLVAVCFIFSYIGSADSTATAFIGKLDEVLGLAPESTTGNVDLLKEYLTEESADKAHPAVYAKLIESGIDVLSQDYTWLINLLAANSAYFKRNAREVAGYLLLAAAAAAFLRFFVQNVLIIGKNRFVMEHRYQKNTRFRRTLAPFHHKTLWNVIYVMLRYHIGLLLWGVTIIGGVYKYFEYYMIPYVLAENPSVSWKKAHAISREMTKGYKFKIFCLKVSMWYIELLKLIPIAGLLISVPYQAAVNAEIYFELRGHVSFAHPELCERQFDAPAWWERSEMCGIPDFELPDIVAAPPAGIHIKPAYRLTDYVLFFFVFCVAGWLWEVALHLIQCHELVNRGTMYGPWLPIYGTGGVLCILLLDRFKEDMYKTFVLIMALAGVLEFFTSWYLDFFHNAHYWQYYDKFANLNGRICLEGLLIFGIGGSFAIYIAAPYLSKWFGKWNGIVRMAVCIILSLLFAADWICCQLFGLNSGAGVRGEFL